MSRESFETAVADFSHSVGMLVRRLRATATPAGMSWSETAVLRRLAKDGASTTADLARSQGMRPQSMRTIVAALEATGMVRRKPHATDGRQVNLELTARGAALAKSAGDAKDTWIAQAFAELSADERDALFAAGKIVRRMVEEDRP